MGIAGTSAASFAAAKALLVEKSENDLDSNDMLSAARDNARLSHDLRSSLTISDKSAVTSLMEQVLLPFFTIFFSSFSLEYNVSLTM